MAAGRRHPRSDRCAMSGWNLADIWEAASTQIPDAPFAKQGSRTLTWREADRRADVRAHHVHRHRRRRTLRLR